MSFTDYTVSFADNPEEEEDSFTALRTKRDKIKYIKLFDSRGEQIGRRPVHGWRITTTKKNKVRFNINFDNGFGDAENPFVCFEMSLDADTLKRMLNSIGVEDETTCTCDHVTCLCNG